MKKLNYMGLLHEINSPIASLQAILFTNQKNISPELNTKLSHHLTRLIQASTVLSELVSTDTPSSDQLIRLLKIWLELHQTSFQEFTTFTDQKIITHTHPISGKSTKTEYTDLIWDICQSQAKHLHGSLHKTSSTLTLSLPLHLQP